MRRRTRIALIVNFLDNAYQIGFRDAVERAAHARGADLIVAVGRELEHPMPNERALNVVYRWLKPAGIDGVVILSAAIANFCGTEGVARLATSLMPLPTCSVGLPLEGVPSIVLDNRAAMKVATLHLIREHGARRLGYIGGPAHNAEAAERLQGYRDALVESGIATDESLITYGHFNRETGADAARTLLRRNLSLDGLLAANDYMALGAIEVLEGAGLQVPAHVRVMGFDDSEVARYAPRTLSSIAQPIDAMADRAVELVCEAIAGRGEPRVWSLPVHLTRRESCGCVEHSALAHAVHRETPPQLLELSTTAVLERVLANAGPHHALWCRALTPLLEAFARGHQDFVEELARLCGQPAASDFELEELGRALAALRGVLIASAPSESEQGHLDLALHQGLLVLATGAARRAGRRSLTLEERAHSLRQLSQGLSVSLDPQGLGINLGQVLSEMDIRTAAFATLSDADGDHLTPWLALDGDDSSHWEPSMYPTAELFPLGFPSPETAKSILLLPLTFGSDPLGLLCLDAATEPFISEAMRGQLSAALKLGSLHERVVTETAQRERLLHEQFLGELAVAKRIQTALLPRDFSGLGLLVYGGSVAADQVGGDYFDVLPAEGGGWIAIGDVTGHGLMAGMIMLMLQSAVSAVLHTAPSAPPASIVAKVNEVMRPNIRERLCQNEHVTFLLTRYFDDGRLVFSGAHEDVLVLRHETGRVETFASDGVWLGILEDISEHTRDQELHLNVGDVLVLFTDGITEARNAQGEQFGLERLISLVERVTSREPAAIYDTVLNAVRRWAAVLQDDITLVAARRTS